MYRMLNDKGFASILEVIVSSIIFMTAAVGFFSSVSMISPQGGSSTKKLEALYVGKQVAESLRSQVYGNIWAASADGPLDPYTKVSQTIGDFTVNYMLYDVPGMQLRRMIMNITYPD